MKKSIRLRLLKGFVVVTLLTVAILELFLIIGTKKYYYNSLADTLTNKIDFTINYYNRYLSNYTLDELVMDDIDVFWNNSSSQVQLYNKEGVKILDSIGVVEKNTSMYTDINEALAGRKGVWYGSVSYFDEPVLSVSIPFMENGENVGAIRFVSSLGPTNRVLAKLNQTLLLMGIAIASISFIASAVLANGIVRPIIKLTRIASKMADGQLSVRSNLELDDEIGELSDTLDNMAEELQRKEQLKNEFISSISHELRTPLTSIKGWASTLNELQPLEADLLHSGLDIIEKESDRLSKMVEELLDFSRYISGRVTLNKQCVDAVELVGGVVEQLSQNKRSCADIIFKSELKNIPVILDEDRIRQVLINIIDNAIKFSEDSGSVEVSVFDSKSRVVIKVVDNGIGMTQDELEHVKEKFYKGKHKNSHAGLGLSISNEIVELHGGELNIVSEYNLGTTVEICLPKGDVK